MVELLMYIRSPNCFASAVESHITYNVSYDNAICGQCTDSSEYSNSVDMQQTFYSLPKQ
jgi:hypothetical protein